MRSTIEYGCIVYGTAAKISLQKVTGKYRAIRLCIEAPLELRRKKHTLAYWVRLKGSGEENLSKKTLQDWWQ